MESGGAYILVTYNGQEVEAYLDRDEAKVRPQLATMYACVGGVRSTGMGVGQEHRHGGRSGGQTTAVCKAECQGTKMPTSWWLTTTGRWRHTWTGLRQR